MTKSGEIRFVLSDNWLQHPRWPTVTFSERILIFTSSHSNPETSSVFGQPVDKLNSFDAWNCWKPDLELLTPKADIFSDVKKFPSDSGVQFSKASVQSESCSVFPWASLCRQISERTWNGVFSECSSVHLRTMFAVISGRSVFPLLFCGTRRKSKLRILQEEYFAYLWLPMGSEHFPQCSQHLPVGRGAQPHNLLYVQTFSEEHFHDFLRRTEWSAALPDINPCDFFLWRWLEEQVNTKNYPSVI